jgi:hypothetical protein
MRFAIYITIRKLLSLARKRGLPLQTGAELARKQAAPLLIPRPTIGNGKPCGNAPQATSNRPDVAISGDQLDEANRTAHIERQLNGIQKASQAYRHRRWASLAQMEDCYGQYIERPKKRHLPD